MIGTDRYYLLTDFNLQTQRPWIQGDKEAIISEGIYNSTLPTCELRKIIKAGKDKFTVIEENRLPAVSIMSEDMDDLHIIANFTQTFGLVTNRYPQYMAYADYGLIPFAFFPTCIQSSTRGTVKSALLKTGLTVYDKPAVYCHNIKKHRQYNTDLWVSRLEVAEKLNLDPVNLKTLDLYKGVLNI